MKICCVGISVQDRIFSLDSLPGTEGKYFAKSFNEQGGGPAATAAVTCARLGADTDLIARVGDDSTGKGIVAEIAAENVNTNNMIIVPGATSTQASILVDTHGHRIIVSYPSPDLPSTPAALENIDFSQYDAVLADVRWHEGALKAFYLAKKAGVPTVLDADVTPQPIGELVALASHSIFSEPGLKKFAGTDDLNEALCFAASKTEGRVYVTLGDAGYSYVKKDKIRSATSFKVDVVDTTGAGDVFHGAFAYALCCPEMSTGERLRFAAATAALKCTKQGGRSGIPDLNEVKKFCSEYDL